MICKLKICKIKCKTKKSLFLKKYFVKFYVTFSTKFHNSHNSLINYQKNCNINDTH